MAQADKATAVADIAEQFKSSTATVITEYRGLTVANLAELRRSLSGSATYSVAKNTLIKRAASEAGRVAPRGVAQLVEHRSPKPAVAGSSPVAPAKDERPTTTDIEEENS